MSTERDIEICGEKKWDDHRESQEKMSPFEEVEMLLKRALMDQRLGFNIAAQNSVRAALEIVQELGAKYE